MTLTVVVCGRWTRTVTRTFTVNVTAVNDPPTLDAIADPPAILEDAGLQTVNLTGITAGGGESQTLTVTASERKSGVNGKPTESCTSRNTNESMSYTPDADANC